MRHILILGAGKSATVLIKALLKDAHQEDWMLHVADGMLSAAAGKIKQHERGKAYAFDIDDPPSWQVLVDQSDLVISMLPPPLHPIVAAYCLRSAKHFLNASYLSDSIRKMHQQAMEKGLLFLNEMGLDPGIDHMSAMEMMDQIREQGGIITSFRSHCGGLISPESDDNPWHYKISWNPRNIVTAGKNGARYLENGKIIELPYADLFDARRTVDIPGLGPYAWYPNRDSVSYKELYQLDSVQELIRTTLRHPDFCAIWSLLVTHGLTDETELINTESIKYKDYFNEKINQSGLMSLKSINQLSYIGAFSESFINLGMASPADILQHLMERTLALKEGDRDMVIMLHEINYIQDAASRKLRASLIIKGDDQVDTAMAKTVGLPLAIAAKLVLNGTILKRGVRIPVDKEIYFPVMRELEKNGIYFKSMI